MKFSYTTKETLLDSIDLHFDGGIILVTGVENFRTEILGGILANLVPAEIDVDISQIASLTEKFCGLLEIDGDDIPRDIAYVGADPDRHLLFSTVKEEAQAFSNEKKICEKLITFGLDETFLERPVVTLSGGEKMRAALALAFAKETKCYVLHGVFPWLDKEGRRLLLKNVQKAKAEKIQIVFIEQEIELLLPFVDLIYEFDGLKLHVREKRLFLSKREELQRQLIAWPNFQECRVADRAIVKFCNVILSEHPFSESPKRTKVLLNDVSFFLQKEGVYFLRGENGAGKSTIVQLIYRLFMPTFGTIFFDGKPLQSYSRSFLNQKICYVSQFPAQQLIFHTVGDYRRSRANDEISIYLLNTYLHVADDFPVSSLDVLEQKLLCFFSELAKTTELVILDEPTWGLDSCGRIYFLNMLAMMNMYWKFTLLIISHDHSCFNTTNAEVLELCDGKIIMR